MKHLGDACGVGACADGTVVCGDGGAELVCDSHGLADVDVCDGVDNDCDGSVDEGVGNTYYPDEDGDGYGDIARGTTTCSPPDGWITVGGDCDDHMYSVNPDGIELCNGLDDDCDGLTDTEDTWGDNSTGDIAQVNNNCDNFDWVLAADVEQAVSEYWSRVKGSGTDVFPHPVMAGGHTVGATDTHGWPSGCMYFDNVQFYGHLEGSDTYNTRAIILCFSKGTDVGGLDEVYAEMITDNGTVPGVLDNEQDDDPPELDSVYFAADESTSDYQVWYVSDSFYASGGSGFSAWEVTMSFYNMRVVLQPR